MSRCAPTNAPSAAIERHPWAASCSSPGLKWILTSMLPLPDTTWTLVFRPPRETPTDREPSFSAPRPRAGGPVESAAAWLRAFVSSRDLFCLATENRTQDTGHAPISSPDQSTHNFGRCPTVPHLWNRNLLNHDSINRTMAVFIFEGG